MTENYEEENSNGNGLRHKVLAWVFFIFGILAFASFLGNLSWVSDLTSWSLAKISNWAGFVLLIAGAISSVIDAFRGFFYPIISFVFGWVNIDLPPIGMDILTVVLAAFGRSIPQQITYFGVERDISVVRQTVRETPRRGRKPKLAGSVAARNLLMDEEVNQGAEQFLNDLFGPAVSISRKMGGLHFYAVAYFLIVFAFMSTMLVVDYVYTAVAA